MKHCKSARGLTIPHHIAATLPLVLIGILQDSGHGYSFNSSKSLQMHYVINGKDLGGICPLDNYGS